MMTENYSIFYHFNVIAICKYICCCTNYHSGNIVNGYFTDSALHIGMSSFNASNPHSYAVVLFILSVDFQIIILKLYAVLGLPFFSTFLNKLEPLSSCYIRREGYHGPKAFLYISLGLSAHTCSIFS